MGICAVHRGFIAMSGRARTTQTRIPRPENPKPQPSREPIASLCLAAGGLQIIILLARTIKKSGQSFRLSGENTMPYVSKPIVGPVSNNAAIRQCCEAFMTTHRACIAAGDGNVFSGLEAEKCYRAAMPPLSGYQNICDFIACTAHGISIGAINSREANHLIAAAKTALSLLHEQPVPPKIRKTKSNKFFTPSPNTQSKS